VCGVDTLPIFQVAKTEECVQSPNNTLLMLI